MMPAGLLPNRQDGQAPAHNHHSSHPIMEHGNVPYFLPHQTLRHLRISLLSLSLLQVLMVIKCRMGVHLVGLVRMLICLLKERISRLHLIIMLSQYRMLTDHKVYPMNI
jgi:hypothetical protein